MIKSDYSCFADIFALFNSYLGTFKVNKVAKLYRVQIKNSSCVGSCDSHKHGQISAEIIWTRSEFIYLNTIALTKRSKLSSFFMALKLLT